MYIPIRSMKEVFSSMNVMYDINPNGVKASRRDAYELSRVIPLEGLNRRHNHEGYGFCRASENLPILRNRVLSSYEMACM